MLKSFRGPSFIENNDQTFVKQMNGGLVVDLPTTRDTRGDEMMAAVSVYNPAFDRDYLSAVPRSNTSQVPSEFGAGETASSSPYDYIDASKLDRDDEEFNDSFSDVASVISSPSRATSL